MVFGVSKYSNQTIIKINKLIKNLCKLDTKIKLVFSSFKIKQFFSYNLYIIISIFSHVLYFSCLKYHAF